MSGLSLVFLPFDLLTVKWRLECFRGPRFHSRTFSLHSTYIYTGHEAPLPPLHTSSHSHIYSEKLPNKTATTCTTTKLLHEFVQVWEQEDAATRLHSRWIVCELYQRSTRAGFLIVLSLLPLPFQSFLPPPCPHLAWHSHSNEAFQLGDKVVKASYAPC